MELCSIAIGGRFSCGFLVAFALVLAFALDSASISFLVEAKVPIQRILEISVDVFFLAAFWLVKCLCNGSRVWATGL